jgi:Domain of unknown function (DU1801)
VVTGGLRAATVQNMARADADATAQREVLLAEHTPDVRATFDAACALVREVMPDATEQVDLPDHLVAFGLGQPGGVRMRDLAVAVAPHKAHVNVQLAHGALLDDPTGMVEGTGKRIRHVKCRSVADVERPALRAILEQQERMTRG